MNLSKLVTKPDEVDIVIYHGGCSDGFGSALASYIYFKPTNGINKNGNKVEYFPGVFKQPPPNVKGKNVLICDFSYDKKTLEKMIDDANTLSIIDHHKTARRILREISTENKYFNMKHSGASLTWTYFFPDQELPLLIRYIEDTDIWLKKMEHTDAISLYIYSLPFEFSEYEKLLDDNYIKEILPYAIGMWMKNEADIKQALGSATIKFYKNGSEYNLVAHVNATTAKSDIGNRLLSKFPYCDYSAVYSKRDSTTYFSLRSEDNKSDTTKISTKFGGGGHRNASGMTTINSTEIPTDLIDNNITYKFLETNFISVNDNENFIRCCTTFNVHNLGKYLLQKVFDEQLPGLVIDEDDERDDDELSEEEYKVRYRPVQKFCSVMRVKKNDPTYYKTCKVCIIMTHMPDCNIIYNIFWTDHDLTDRIKNIFEKCKDFTLTQEIRRASFVSSIYNVNTDVLLSKFNKELE